MCTCQSCGKKYGIDLMIPDELWEQIKPEKKPIGSGLLCPTCIMGKIETLFEYYVFELKDGIVNSSL